MKRGRTERETCDLNGWGVGTILRGHEEWGTGDGVWTTLRITALGETSLLARCLKHEQTAADSITATEDCAHREGLWTLDCRDWEEVTP